MGEGGGGLIMFCFQKEGGLLEGGGFNREIMLNKLNI